MNSASGLILDGGKTIASTAILFKEFLTDYTTLMMTAYENILGYPVFAGGMKKLYHNAVQRIGNGEKIYICCLNPHSYTVSRRDPVFKSALLNASFIIPDGVGIKLASRYFLDNLITETIPGPDFFDYFCTESLREGKRYKHFFLGSTTDTLQKLSKNAVEKFGINVVGFCSPPFKKSFTEDDNAEMIAIINQYKPDVLWVGMTAPKQEKWMYLNLDQLNVKMAAGIGAAFDFYAGTVKRAPVIMRNIGAEGIYRLIVSPRRVFKRALISDPLFAYFVIKECFVTRRNTDETIHRY